MSLRLFTPRELPEGLEALSDLALDLRWIWSHSADHIWRHIDAETWEATRNPWLILQEISDERLVELAKDDHFRSELQNLLEARRQNLAVAPQTTGDGLLQPVAYFSMEFGLGDAIPLYAGGLGVLAGDHLEAASDLGVPLVGVGLLYQEGYFRQFLDEEGKQEELFPYNDPSVMPIQPTVGSTGGWLRVPVDLPGRTLWLRVWQAMVGNIPLYLLDANVPTNEPGDRGITGKLYADGPEMRLRQELALGVGGWRLLEQIGVRPGACHLNEGHAAFAVLERTRALMLAHDLPFGAAFAAARGANVFTTHTPVSAGFDAFSVGLMRKYFPEEGGLLGDLGLSFDGLMALGQAPGTSASEPFCPTFLATRGSARVNGVSALHAETSRRLFAPLFPRWPLAEVPVSHVTNGVHMPSWDSSFTDELWTAACGPDRWRGPLEGHATAISSIEDATLWSVRAKARRELVQRVRSRLARQLARRGAPTPILEEAGRVLDPDVLTLGFARRFAEYKRPNLLLKDEARLQRLLTDERRPVQLLVAGKAHPGDQVGKALIQAWSRFSRDTSVRSRCVFLEDYDLSLAQELVQGVDVWINTPRRPWEACGTSGMKVLVNGGLNLSVLDGWWAEAFSPEVGWAIGTASGAPRTDAQDAHDLLWLLENEVIPAFYDRDEQGLPRSWLAKVRASLSHLTPCFSAGRMLSEYVAKFYRPAERDLRARLEGHGPNGRALDGWSQHLRAHWASLRFGDLTTVATERGTEILVDVFFGEISPDEASVQLFADGEEPIPMTNRGPRQGTSHGFRFGALAPVHRPCHHYTPRIIPKAETLKIPQELPLITWHH